MSRKRKPLPIIENLTIETVAAEGNAIGRHDGAVVFVPFCSPGDVVDVQVLKKKKNYMQGRVLAFRTRSENHLEPRCSHFGVCGGCAWQHLPYELQLRFKRQQVVDCMERIAKVEIPEIAPTLPSENIWRYRNKMEYAFSNKKWLTQEQLDSGVEFDNRDGAGFHISGAFDKVLDIDECHLPCGPGNEIRNYARSLARETGMSFYDIRGQQGGIRNMMVRTVSTGQTMVLVQFGEEARGKAATFLDALVQRFPDITSIYYVINPKVNDTFADLELTLYKGESYIEEVMEGLRFRIGPKSFYQTNSAQAHRLYSVARDMAALTGSELVYDLYTGTGTIANFVARKASKVIGIEYVEDAVADARVNSQVNGIGNTEFFAGDMKDVLSDDFIAEHGRPDVMIIDPPRAGMHTDVVDTVLRAEPRVIVYVSCNPATQARDIALMDGKYRVEAVQPVDMFPHTAHVENVVRLVLRQ